MQLYNNIVILGAGSIGTAIGNSLAGRDDLTVRLLSIEEDVIDSISKEHINQKYFPNLRLNPRLQASTNELVLQDADIVILAIPSVAAVDYLLHLKPNLPKSAIILNLAKGFGTEKRLISECLKQIVPNPVGALKGPSFAREIMNNIPTALTLASENTDLLKNVSPIFEGTNIYIDQTTDITGVEILSILKNIYAIIIGIVDAQFNSPNLRFMIFTKAFNEMRNILQEYKGQEETMFKYCGIGDFGLTALNDLSRNRTLGLLIGKGFFTEDISGKVVLEGRIAMNIILEHLESTSLDKSKYSLMSELQHVFKGNNDVPGFVNELLRL
ncbi:MAG: NAD(P)-binding domain-containing protein [Bacteroidales bacterium]|nr:NAD(P)-binding domain-containing protein [Bacteroidales bacterium]